jgi:outer membrane protein
MHSTQNKKNMRKITFLLAIFFASTACFLYGQKIGHVNLDSLISLMPEFKTAKEKSEAKLKSLESFLMNLKGEYDQKVQKAQTDYNNMSEIERKNIEEELAGMQQRIQARQTEAQNEYQVYNNSMLKPIYDKAKKAIEKVAKTSGYKYIFDTTAGNVLYSEPADDVIMLVKKELDTMPAVKLPDNPTSQDAGKSGGNLKPKTGGK